VAWNLTGITRRVQRGEFCSPNFVPRLSHLIENSGGFPEASVASSAAAAAAGALKPIKAPLAVE
jgi:hypothetical protein